MINRIKHLYLHVPFCNTICYYCDFCHRIYDYGLVEKWLDTLSLEINDKCKDQYETIYIGGGTPSSLNINQLNKLLNLIKPYTNKIMEYTIEVNPESIDEEKIRLLKQYNINRISMGVQTSNDKLLKSLNRKHSFEDVINKINLLKQYDLTNISIDLMYSLPNQNMEILNSTLDDFLTLDIPHVSIYSLTIENNTVFGKKGIKSLDEDLEADMYELIIDRLSNNGYKQYEVSNFCRNGYESKHNIGYWKYDDFLGISLGASSKVGSSRWTNTTNFNSYFDDFNSKDEDILLTKKELMFENIMMSLRMSDGLNIEEFNNKYNVDFIKIYDKALIDNNICSENGFVKVRNMALLNRTLLEFMDIK